MDDMSSHEIAVEILRRMEAEKKRRAARKRKMRACLSVAACLLLVIGISVCVPMFISDEHLQESTWTHTASMTGGDSLIGLIMLIVVLIITPCFAVVLYRRKKKRRNDEKNH